MLFGINVTTHIIGIYRSALHTKMFYKWYLEGS